jgi:hypothetical protein
MTIQTEVRKRKRASKSQKTSCHILEHYTKNKQKREKVVMLPEQSFLPKLQENNFI